MTRKLVYDPKLQRVRMVGWTTGSQRALPSSQRGSLRWIAVALLVAASAWAFDAAHASSRGEQAPAEASR